jgi:hypothetical protein
MIEAVTCSQGYVAARQRPNIRVEFARVARPTRNVEAPLLAAHAARYAGTKS